MNEDRRRPPARLRGGALLRASARLPVETVLPPASLPLPSPRTASPRTASPRTDSPRTASPLAILLCALLLLAVLVAGPAAADGGVTFENLAARQGSGLDYRRAPSEILAVAQRLERLPAMNFGHVVAAPEKPRGAPGVALLDFDGDGDLDLYVTNGPGAANSLYANRLAQTGEVGFVDVAKKAGVEARTQDSTGVCFGDTDNDGDPDLLVLGRMEANRFFENRGDGTFREAARSGLEGGQYGHASCTFGDVDNDGLLDVAVANSFDWASRPAIFSVPYALNHPNQLFRNLGENRFADVSETSGIRDVQGVQPPIDEGATMTWAIALVDYDQDGDLDLFHADDQAALAPDQAMRGYVHLFRNDGTGRFENVTRESGLGIFGAWMGLSFGDFDCDGHLDLFATNWGDYAYAPIGFPFERGQWSSRWFLGGEDGVFRDPGVGELRATPFGWTAMTVDYDNDADLDVAYFGGLGTAVYTIVGDNPGALLQNPGCSARFTRDAGALAADHGRRVVEGGAAGDLDGNGFPDLVSVSSHDVPQAVEQKSYRLDHGSPFDASAVYTEFLEPAPGGSFVPRNLELLDGSLVVEMNSGGNGNGWAAVRPVGTVGLVEGGRVNRSGIGAVLRFQPEGGAAVTRPVVGGANYASQDSLETTFGLGRAESATVEVLWPGGTRNRLQGVGPGERLVLPEIPCSYDGRWAGEGEYRACVEAALGRLAEAGVLPAAQKGRFLESALAAFREVDRADEDEATPEAPRPQEGTDERRPARGEDRDGAGAARSRAPLAAAASIPAPSEGGLSPATGAAEPVAGRSVAADSPELRRYYRYWVP